MDQGRGHGRQGRAAVLEWATENDATTFTHAFQPQGASGVRHGLVGMVQNAFFKFDNDGVPVWDLKGKDLIQGETDGRRARRAASAARHCAGGYVQVDSSSPIYLRGDTIFIPSCLVSFFGDALDEKTPLLRSVDALQPRGRAPPQAPRATRPRASSRTSASSREDLPHPRATSHERQDLMLSGRTIIGRRRAARPGDVRPLHGRAVAATAALACMQEIQAQCFRLGIPLRTRHREVAPNQYESRLPAQSCTPSPRRADGVAACPHRPIVADRIVPRDDFARIITPTHWDLRVSSRRSGTATRRSTSSS